MQYGSIGWSVGALLGTCAAAEDGAAVDGAEAMKAGKTIMAGDDGIRGASGSGEMAPGERRRPILLCGDGAFQMTAQAGYSMFSPTGIPMPPPLDSTTILCLSRWSVAVKSSAKRRRSAP